MIRTALTTFAGSVLCLPLLLATGALAEDVAADSEQFIAEPAIDYAALARNNTIVWFKEKSDTQMRSALNQLANGRSFSNIEKPPTFAVGTLKGVVLNVGVEEAHEMLTELNNRSRGDGSENLDARLALDTISSVEPDGIVELFDTDCGPDEAVPLPANDNYEASLPEWFLYTGAPLKPKSTDFSRSVWVIDSGISRFYDADDTDESKNELNVERGSTGDRSANCLDADPSKPCVPDTPDTTNTSNTSNTSNTFDRVGHGTMIAGIIGSKENAKWFKGIAPEFNLIAIKAFKGRKVNWMTIYKALQYVAANAEPGDVVNISFGGPWSFVPPQGLPTPNTRAVEEMLRQMVRDKNLRIAIAAGNISETSDINNSGYVQTISPARAGGFRNGTGMIMTASAAGDSEFNNSTFTPAFWPYSGFGNKCGAGGHCTLGPPDFAEPGVKIESLWTNGEKNICSGTSFSAAVLSGLLVQGTDIEEKAQVIDDPSGSDPTMADANDDWVGSCLVNDGSACKEVPP